MKKEHIIQLLAFITCIAFCSCGDSFSTAKADLAFEDDIVIFNQCTQRNERLKPSNFYTVRNLHFPFNNYPEFVFLYLNDETNTLHDCFGYQWFLANGTVLTSSRTLINKKATLRKTESAHKPAISHYVTVVGDNGDEQTTNYPSVVFDDLAPNETKTFQTQLSAISGKLIKNGHIIDPDRNIDERNENNNSDDSYLKINARVSHMAGAIKFLTNDDLKTLKKPYVICDKGNIVIVK